MKCQADGLAHSQSGWTNSSLAPQRQEGGMGQNIPQLFSSYFQTLTRTSLYLQTSLFHPAFPSTLQNMMYSSGPQSQSKRCADATLWCVALCVWQGLCFFFFCCTAQHSRLKETVLCVTQSRRLHWWSDRFAWRTILYHMQMLECVPGDNPMFKCLSWERLLTCLWGKHRSSRLFPACTNRAELNSTLLHPLKRVNRSNHRDYKALLWGLLLGSLEKPCNSYSRASVAVSSPQTSPPVSVSLSLLASRSPHLQAQQGSSSVKVSPPRCRSLPPQTPCRAPRCGWWSSGSHRGASRPSGPLHWR